MESFRPLDVRDRPLLRAVDPQLPVYGAGEALGAGWVGAIDGRRISGAGSAEVVGGAAKRGVGRVTGVSTETRRCASALLINELRVGEKAWGELPSQSHWE